MSPNRAMGGSMNSVLFVSVAIVLVAITGVAAFTLPRSSNPLPFVGQKSITTESAGGLLLGLSLNETTIAPGQTISITVYERNTLQKACPSLRQACSTSASHQRSRAWCFRLKRGHITGRGATEKEIGRGCSETARLFS